MTFQTAILIGAFLFLAELAYFYFAVMFNIIDKPNHRSSHSSLTIRGGGIIFLFGILLTPIYDQLDYFYFLIGAILISITSFLDDIKPLSNKIRITVHMISVGFLILQFNQFGSVIYSIPIVLFISIGVVNAMNFMDGINGMTGVYSLCTVVTLWFINHMILNFVSSDFILLVMISIIVFNFFNFRKRAKCFAGDVGSITIAFILVFLIGKLILTSNNINYLLLLVIYGLDTGSTMLFRSIRKENVFEAHRSHFYQSLANEKGFSHITVSVTYAIAQLVINLTLLFYINNSLPLALFLLIILIIGFIIIRFLIEGKTKLLSPKLFE